MIKQTQRFPDVITGLKDLNEKTVRATSEEAIAGIDSQKIITPKTLSDVIEANGGVGGGTNNVFRTGGIPGSFTASKVTNVFNIPDINSTKETMLVFNNLILVENTDYSVDKKTGEVTLSFNLEANETIHYMVISTSYSYNDLVDLPEDTVDSSFVENKIAELVGSAPETLDTLKELGDALGNDPNFATTVTTELGKKVDKTYVDTQDGALTKQITDCKVEIDNVKDQVSNIDVSWASVTGKPNTFPPSSHTHSASNISAGTMTGVVVAQTNTSYTTRQIRNVVLSTANPTGGNNGDVWLKYV